MLASFGGAMGHVGRRWPLDGPSVIAEVVRTGEPARMDDDSRGHGSIADATPSLGATWSVGVPIVVDGRLWGVMIAGSREPESVPGQTEARLTTLTELLATAIANTESRTALAASRARVVATADATRRRIERDLHDGAQQRLVSLALELRAAQAALPTELVERRAELSSVVEELTGVLDGCGRSHSGFIRPSWPRAGSRRR